MVRISRPWMVPTFLTAAVLFWSWVAFWFVEHTTRTCGPPPRHPAYDKRHHPIVELVDPFPAPPNLAPPPDAPLEADIRAAVLSVIPAIKAQSRYLPRDGRVEVRVSITERGRVSRVDIDAGRTELSAVGRRVIERLVKRTAFPANPQAYQTEFPLILASNDD